MLVDSLPFYLVAVPAILLTGISKGGFASAFSGIAVPLMALTIAPAQAAGIMLPVLILMDMFGLTQFWRRFDRAILMTMIPGALIGTAVGWITFHAFDENLVRVLIGAIAVLYPLSRWLRPSRAATPAAPSVAKGTFWSAISGYTSFVAHTGGPPVMLYMMPMKLDRAVFASTTGVFFTFANLIKLPPYALLGQLNFTNLGTALLLAPLAPLGVKLGVWLQGKVNNEQFYRIGQTCIFLTGSRLLYDGLHKSGAFQ